MFSVAYVILPFADVAPADAIRASLAPFQRGGRGNMPDDRLAFDDETDLLRCAHEARVTFTDKGGGGLQIEGGNEGHWHLDSAKVRDEMRRLGLETWHVRFADTMHLDTFYRLFCHHRLERHPSTGGYGRWLNPLGRWDWWDLGGGFDGQIIGEPNRAAGRSAAQVSSGPNTGRSLLSNLDDVLRVALDQEPAATIDVRSDRNIELAATLLAAIRVHREHACPGAIVLPPGSVEEDLRWLATWPRLGPLEAFARLNLAPEASWPEVVEASYALFQDHWVAAVAYHH